MNRATRTASVLLLAGMMLSVATPALPTGSAVPEPGAVGIPIDPNAPGTKLVGPLSIAYVIQGDDFTCISGRRVMNMFVVVTLEQGNNIKPFNRDFSKTDPPTPSVCFDDQTAQVAFVFDLITTDVMPFFFGLPLRSCFETGGVRPCWAVKSITDFLSSNEGAMSMNVTLAVQ